MSSTSQSTGSSKITVSQLTIPSQISAGSKASVMFTVMNPGAPIQGIYTRIDASINFGFAVIKKTIDCDNQDQIPSGTTTKSLTFDVPADAKGRANVCVTAYSDKARTNAISDKVCKDVMSN